jgi:phosphohistidine phosphatase
MNLLIVRHAIAFERDRQRWRDDTARPLSPEGVLRGRKSAAGLKQLVGPPQRVFTSPLVRARQTAEILTEFAGWPRATECPELSPDEPPRSLLALLSRERGQLIAVVGHQPGLGYLLAACLVNDAAALPIELKKPGIACVAFNGAPRAGRGILNWLATPGMLRALR